MARQLDLISTTDGTHILCFGVNNNEVSNFKAMLWITHYHKRALDWIQSLSLGFLTWMGGDAWLHNSDDVPRANFYGEQKTTEVEIIANQNHNVIKILDAIGIHTDAEWEVESVTIPKTLNYPNGMYSKIPSARFKKREGVYQAEFLRNMYTTSATAKINEAISGDHLKGYAAYIVLKNTSTDQMKLYKIDLRMTSAR